MVITKLVGGLGNQMFQYAAGSSLAYSLNTGLKVDKSAYDHVYKVWPYGLDCFKLKPVFAPPKEVAVFTKINQLPSTKTAKLLRFLLGKFTNKRYFQEKHFHFDPDFFSLSPKNDYYLSGHWISEKYFKKIADFIRTAFTVKTKLRGRNLEFARRIRRTTSVSIHVRRGDYISDKKANAFHGTCDLPYYRRCLTLITKKIMAPTFYVFSDDPKWCKQNLRFKHTTLFIDYNQDKNYEDLRLMSLCRHNIIANSTFSWWGAWLNQNPNKLVLAPKQWFKDKNLNTKDLLPENWLKV